jgi:four helix bundle protein
LAIAEVEMLNVTVKYLALMGRMRAVFETIEKQDRWLGDQIRRASSSVALNQAEGYGSHKGNRLVRYKTAFGSLRELQTALQVAVLRGYIAPLEPKLADELDHVAAMSWRLMNPKSPTKAGWSTILTNPPCFLVSPSSRSALRAPRRCC